MIHAQLNTFLKTSYTYSLTYFINITDRHNYINWTKELKNNMTTTHS